MHLFAMTAIIWLLSPREIEIGIGWLQLQVRLYCQVAIKIIIFICKQFINSISKKKKKCHASFCKDVIKNNRNCHALATATTVIVAVKIIILI